MDLSEAVILAVVLPGFSGVCFFETPTLVGLNPLLILTASL